MLSNNVLYSIIMILVIALCTALLRFLPFLIFGTRETPPFISYLGRYLPFAIMAMLVVYCLKNVSLIASPHGLPEFIAVGVTALIHIWRRNTLLSIIIGTICYMILIQVVF